MGDTCDSGLAGTRLRKLPSKLLVMSVGVGEGVSVVLALRSISLNSLSWMRLVDDGSSSIEATLV